ncbi:MAG: hypothetical protein O3C45_07545 [Bacteroidetes bacterium]|nr:hypothetical protein [Bacteroidota bacterium]
MRSNAPEAGVYADGVWLGRVADGPFQIGPAIRQIRVAPASGATWSLDPLLFDVSGLEESPLVLEARFRLVYQFDSAPSGAEVRQGGRVLGRTPLRLSVEEPLDSAVGVYLDGFKAASVMPGDALWNRYLLELERDPSAQAVATGYVVETGRRDWVSIAAATSAMAAGALAIHFRTKADNRFNDYQEKGNLVLKSDIRRLDVQSGVALGAMQLGLGVVVFRLAF